MRILLVLVLGLGLMAYRNLQPHAPQPPMCTASPVCQAGSIFFQSADGGTTWQDISAGLPDTMNSLLALNGEVYVGSANGILYHSRQPENGVWEQENLNDYCVTTGEFFSNVDQRLPENYIMNILPGHTGPVVHIYNRGFFRQKPGTKVWQSINETLAEKTLHTLLESASGSLFIGAGTGIYKSADQGKTWNQVYTGGWVSGLFESNGALIGSGSKGLLQSSDGGDHWTLALPDERTNYEFFQVDETVVAACLFGPWRDSYKANPFHVSSNHGATWQPMIEALPAAEHIDDLLQVGNDLFCCYKAGIARSSDGGKTWQLVFDLHNQGKTTSMQLTVWGKTVYAIVRRGGC